MASPQSALDLTVAVTTPENIRFEYQIAGPFRRLPAMLLDIILRYLFVFGLFLLLAWGGFGIGLPGSSTLLVVGILLSVFLLSWFYGLFFETLWNGQTPGKRWMNLRVVSTDGRPINAAQATIRNFIRVADFFPYASTLIFFEQNGMFLFPTLLVSLVCMLSTKRFQRLGDLAAGTMVVVDERGWQAKKIAITNPQVASLAEFIPANFRMSRSMAKAIALYMERRPQMSATRQQNIAMYLAGPLLEHFDFRRDTSADLLLSALYFREFYNEAEKEKLQPERVMGSPLVSDTAKTIPLTLELHPALTGSESVT
jgi:uncharacterized RDD family membrane protein YckC